MGVGNCASSLVQGVTFYRDIEKEGDVLPGLVRARVGGYRVRDVEFSAAFDVAEGKVGLDLSDAIRAKPNNTVIFADPPRTGVIVQRGPTLDGVGSQLGRVVQENAASPVDVVEVFRASRTDVVVNYLPVGSEEATRWYASCALEAGCGFVNCIPVFLASDPEWREKFESRRLPIVGDDVKSQVGATIVHRVLTRLFMERGVRLDRTYQLNVGGNTDFLNMLDRDRLASKRTSKTEAVVSQLSYPIAAGDVHIGPSDYVPWLTDRKCAFIRLEGTAFGGVPLALELKLEVWDSPNSAGVVIDALRCCKLAMDRGLGGALLEPSACFMKRPPTQVSDDAAFRALEGFLGDDGR